MQRELKVLLEREAELRGGEADILAKQAQLARQRADVISAIAGAKESQAKLSEAAGEAARLRFEAQHHTEQREIVLHEARALDSEAERARTAAETARHKSVASTNGGGAELEVTPPKGSRRPQATPAGGREASTKRGSRRRST